MDSAQWVLTRECRDPEVEPRDIRLEMSVVAYRLSLVLERDGPVVRHLAHNQVIQCSIHGPAILAESLRECDGYRTSWQAS